MFKILNCVTLTLALIIVHQLNKIRMNQSELLQALKDIKAQADKSKEEIIAKVASLEDAINNAGTVSPEVETALTDLKASVQTLDDLNPDATEETGGTNETGATNETGGTEETTTEETL